MSGKGDISLYIPLKNTFLSGDDFATCCGCGQKLSHSRRIYHDMSTALSKVGIQQSHLTFSIENQRLRTGEVMRLITTQLHKELVVKLYTWKFASSFGSVQCLSHMHNVYAVIYVSYMKIFG